MIQTIIFPALGESKKVSTKFKAGRQKLVVRHFDIRLYIHFISIYYIYMLTNQLKNPLIFVPGSLPIFWTGSGHTLHSSEIKGFCLMKWPSETLQNLPYFIYTKTQSCFFRFLFQATLLFSLMNALVYVDIDQGIHNGKK